MNFSYCVLLVAFQYLIHNALFTLNRTTHNSVLLLCVVRINVNKTLLPTTYGPQQFTKIGVVNVHYFDFQNEIFEKLV